MIGKILKTAMFASIGIGMIAVAGAGPSAPMAACVDRNGKALAPDKCASVPGALNVPEVKDPDKVPGFENRRALVVKNLREAQGVINKALACAEKSRTETGLRACAKQAPAAVTAKK